ncbi:MAG: RNA polymerase sigma factor [Alphaproteobacteria bacterium]
MTTSTYEDLHEHMPALRRFARSLTRDADRADDLVQDCLERAMSRWHLFEPGTNLGAWLFTICRRIFFNQCRKASNRGIHVEYEDSRMVQSVRPAQEAMLELRELDAAMQALPKGQQRILQMVVWDGFKYEDVARRLDLPIGTVRSRLSRARAHLNRELEREGVAP